MVRIGIKLYGLPPSSEMNPVCGNLGLLPVMRLMARVSMTKILPPGSGVSSGHLFRTSRETVVATLPIGYADGYPRLLSNKGKVLINGHIAPIIGAICMDQCMVDVTDVPNAKDIKPGDEVIMFGDPGPCAEDLAAQIGTIGYELTCGIGKRVPRIYINQNV
jgi:alanine racemase